MKRLKLPSDWHEMNLCYLGNLGYQAQGTRKYRSLASKPEFFCKSCGRAATNEQNLCDPQKL